MKRLIYFLFFFIYLQGCDSSTEKSPSNFSVVRSPLVINLEGESSTFSSGDSVFFSALCNVDSLTFNSIEIYLDDSLVKQFERFPINVALPTSHLRLGNHKIKVSASTSSSDENKSSTITLLSNREPKKYTYQVKNKYNHDKKAYTQGLVFINGFLYEGTGTKGLSTVRKVELESGKVVGQIKNENSIFGEGITVLDDKIYQLSWVSNVGFVYDLITLELLNKFYYDGEGWGLTNDGKILYRTDGSNKVYLHEKESFEIIDIIEVYSDKKAITNLNELEFIDGLIYANIWQEDNIAIIDPKNGALEGLINLKNILPPNERDNRTDVLNGIAYDESGNRLFITGKNWPKVYQIQIIEKNNSIP